MKEISVPVLPLYEFHCDPTLADQFHENVFSQKILWKAVKGAENPAQLGKVITQNYFFHEEFFNWLQECIDKVSAVHLQSKKLTISDYWLTKSIFGENAGIHTHKFSIFSGVYYFSNQEKSLTKFTHPYISNNHYGFLIPDATAPSTTIKITPEKGKLLIFPSFLAHDFTMKDKNVRHSFSFNTFIDGVVCGYDSMELELNVVKRLRSNE